MDPSFPFYNKFRRWPFWIGEKHSCFTPKRQTSDEIEVDISIFLCYFDLCWYIVKHSCDFVPVLIFNLQFFVRVFFKTFIVIFPSSYGTVCLASWTEHIENGISCFQKYPNEIFAPTTLMCLQSTPIIDKFLAAAILYNHSASKAV